PGAWSANGLPCVRRFRIVRHGFASTTRHVERCTGRGASSGAERYAPRYQQSSRVGVGRHRVDPFQAGNARGIDHHGARTTGPDQASAAEFLRRIRKVLWPQARLIRDHLNGSWSEPGLKVGKGEKEGN